MREPREATANVRTLDRLKQMGLDDGHPEKEGILVPIPNLVGEVRRRLEQLRKLEEMTVDASGLRVVDGIKGESVITGDAGSAAAAANPDPAVAEPAVVVDPKPESAS